jgi:putative membrane protein
LGREQKSQVGFHPIVKGLHARYSKSGNSTNYFTSQHNPNTTMKTLSFTLLSKTALALLATLMFMPDGMASPKDTLDAADVKFVKHMGADGMAEVKLAGLAVQKSGRPEVKALAEMIVTDHTAANAEVAELAKTKGVELSDTISPDHAATFQALEKTSATEFDKAYLADVVSSHKKCINHCEDAAKDAKDADVKAWAAKVLPTLKAHLDKAEELSK